MSSYAAIFDAKLPISVVGAGAVGGVMARRLRAAGYPIASVISRSMDSAQLLGSDVRAANVDTELTALAPETRMVLISVPDGAIAGVAEELSHVRHQWEGTLCVHTSGVLTAAELSPLGERGARTLSFHPMQTMRRGSPASVLDGTFAGIEGEPQALASGIRLATKLGMRYVVIAAHDKPRYHLAASIASNFLVTIASVAQQVLASIDIDRATAQAVLQPLVQSTIDNIAESAAEDALTGPVVRGDLGTLRRHGLALRRHLPELVPFYAALATETVPLAVRSGKLDPDAAEAVLELVSRILTLPLPEKRSGG